VERGVQTSEPVRIRQELRFKFVIFTENCHTTRGRDSSATAQPLAPGVGSATGEIRGQAVGVRGGRLLIFGGDGDVVFGSSAPVHNTDILMQSDMRICVKRVRGRMDANGINLGVRA